MPNSRLYRFLIRLGAFAFTLGPATSVYAQISQQLAAQLSQNADQHVIVILKSQHAPVRKYSAEAVQRTAAIDVDQAPSHR